MIFLLWRASQHNSWGIVKTTWTYGTYVLENISSFMCSSPLCCVLVFSAVAAVHATELKAT